MHPGASERCDGVDGDCDGLADDTDSAVDALAFFADADGDGYEAMTAFGLDCDDAAVTTKVVFPNVVEDLRLRHHATLVLKQKPQQIVFRWGELNFGACFAHDMRGIIHLEVVASHRRFGGDRTRSA